MAVPQGTQEGRALRTDSGQASPAPTTLREVTVECGDYGYYTDCFAD
jgi:hypothetical protein